MVDMNITQMKQVLTVASKAYRDAGNSQHEAALRTFVTLLEGHDNKTVSVFANQLSKVLWQATTTDQSAQAPE